MYQAIFNHKRVEIYFTPDRMPIFSKQQYFPKTIGCLQKNLISFANFWLRNSLFLLLPSLTVRSASSALKDEEVSTEWGAAISLVISDTLKISSEKASNDKEFVKKNSKILTEFLRLRPYFWSKLQIAF